VETVSADLLNEVTRRLAAEFKPEQVWLFGSHAWGQPDEGSDLDLLVIVPQSDESPVRRAQRAHRCCEGWALPRTFSSRRALNWSAFAMSAPLSKLRFSNAAG